MTRQRNDDKRKQQIRSAALRCLVRRGYAATTLREIAKEAGLSKGGIYFYYQAKQQLFDEIMETQFEALHERWAFDPMGDEPADRTLARLVLLHVGAMEGAPDEARLCSFLVSMAPQHSAFRAKLEALSSVLRSVYAGVIERGMRDRLFAPGDPEEQATMVVCMVYGLACLAATDPRGRLPLSPEELAENAVRMLRAKAPVDHSSRTLRMTN
jgi:AcrR family transcriptional regulator